MLMLINANSKQCYCCTNKEGKVLVKDRRRWRRRKRPILVPKASLTQAAGSQKCRREIDHVNRKSTKISTYNKKQFREKSKTVCTINLKYIPLPTKLSKNKAIKISKGCLEAINMQ